MVVANSLLCPLLYSLRLNSGLLHITPAFNPNRKGAILKQVVHIVTNLRSGSDAHISPLTSNDILSRS